MEGIKEPRSKHSQLEHAPSLPLTYARNAKEPRKFRATFNGFSVNVEDADAMKTLISRGCFGKATLSRSYPQFKQILPEIIRHRVYINRKQVRKSAKTLPEKVIVIPDSDSEEEASSYFTDFQPKYEVDYSGIRETVQLGLEEAFFLSAALNCLAIYHKEKLLKIEEIWDLFRSLDRFFMQKYAVYYHFRTKNWVIKPGIKFGGDFLLYKEGPQFYHASYVVIINVVDEEFKKIGSMNWRSMAITNLIGLQRLCETVGKELLICDVVWPTSWDETNHSNFSALQIKETLMRRWCFKNEEPATSSGSN